MKLTRGVLALAAGVSLAACANPGVIQSAASSSTSGAYADFLVGRVANLTDDYSAASDRYTSALARDPNNQDLVDGAVSAALAAGDVERARAAARYGRGPDTPTLVHLVRAADALNAQRWSQAESELGLANNGAAQALEARVMLVWARAGRRNVPEIDADLRSLMSIRPFGALFQYNQAMALDYAGRQADALAAYQTASGLGMWLPPAIERNADLLARQQGARDLAIRVLDTPDNQTNPELMAALARVRAGQNAAVTPLTPARGASAALYGLAAIYVQERDVSNGLATLTLALMLDPTNDAARLAFAQAQSDLHHGDLARAMLHQIDAHSVYAPNARTMEAWTLVAENRNDDAIALARTAAADGSLAGKRALADIYRATHHDTEADALYSEMLTTNGDDWHLWFARGAARMRQNRIADGEADMQHALQLAPDQPDVMNYLGYAWVDRGEHVQEGLALIQRAVTLRPNSAAFVDSLGWAHYRMHDYPAALEQLEHAVELEAGDATLNDHLGDVYWRVGRRTEARHQWQRALTLSPDDAVAIQQKIAHGLPAEPEERTARR